jgi:segregation and condensation protein A
MFDYVENRIHAIFLLLSMLELVQQKYLLILIGEGRNNFIVEYNANRVEESDPTLANPMQPDETT